MTEASAHPPPPRAASERPPTPTTRRGAEYTVRLQAFEGPLDLLLFLIRRAEVEITDIPIAEITEQYLRFLDQLVGPEAERGRGGRIDIEQAGEFLVMAATLMEIKSRMLSPKPVVAGGESVGASRSEGEVIDPRAELVRQLLDYKRYRDATDQLEDYRREWDHRFPSARAVVGRPEVDPTAELAADDSPVDIEDLQLIDLIQAFARIVESVDFNRVGEHHVKLDDTPVEVHGERILSRLRESSVLGADGVGRSGGLEFSTLFVGASRSEMIGMFLAILELVKQQRIHVQQEAIAGEGSGIVLNLAPEPAVVVATDSQENPAPAPAAP
ncbi:MAG: segregation/condensation protein A [Phycisphaerales bacterium]|nr:segregation/condensation protein A [Phycisphaerales bacterium]